MTTRLIDQLAERYRTVSLVGMVKNAGKTTLLNELIDQAIASGVRLGLTTTGRDGEKQDLVTHTAKPRIEVTAGTLVATARGMLELGIRRFEVLDVTDLQTAFGPIVIVRMLRAGQVELVGPRTSEGLSRVADLMRHHDVDLVLIDGALDRVSSASPAVADAVLLSTGAALSRDLGQVVRRTIHRMDLLRLKTDPLHRELYASLKSRGDFAAVREDGSVIVLDVETGMNAGEHLAEILDKDCTHLYFPGALTYRTAKALLSHRTSGLVFVVRDGTRIFIEQEEYRELLAMGLRIDVIDPINLIGVSVNPVAPQGYRFDRELLIGELAEKAGGIPVFDVLEG